MGHQVKRIAFKPVYLACFALFASVSGFAAEAEAGVSGKTFTGDWVCDDGNTYQDVEMTFQENGRLKVVINELSREFFYVYTENDLGFFSMWTAERSNADFAETLQGVSLFGLVVVGQFQQTRNEQPTVSCTFMAFGLPFPPS